MSKEPIIERETNIKVKETVADTEETGNEIHQAYM